MNIIAIVITVVVVGLILYLAETYIPMAEPIKKILRIVVIAALIIWLLRVSGLWAYLSNVNV